MPAWGLEGDGLIVLIGLVLGGIIAATLPVMVAGVYDGWLWVVTVLAAVGFGGWGYQEAGWFGGGVSALAAGGLAFFLFGVPIGFFGAMAAFKGDLRNKEGESVHAGWLTRIFLGTGRLVGVALLAVVCFDLYWLVNIAAGISVFNTATAVAMWDPGSESAEDVETRLQPVVEQVQAYKFRPIVWTLRPSSAQAVNDVTELIESANSTDFDHRQESLDLRLRVYENIERAYRQSAVLRFIPRVKLPDAAGHGAARDDASPGDTSPANASPDDTSPDDTSPDNTSPDDASPDDASPDDASPDDTSPDDTSPDDASPDDTSPDDTSRDDVTAEKGGRAAPAVRLLS